MCTFNQERSITSLSSSESFFGTVNSRLCPKMFLVLMIAFFSNNFWTSRSSEGVACWCNSCKGGGGLIQDQSRPLETSLSTGESFQALENFWSLPPTGRARESCLPSLAVIISLFTLVLLVVTSLSFTFLVLFILAWIIVWVWAWSILLLLIIRFFLKSRGLVLVAVLKKGGPGFLVILPGIVLLTFFFETVDVGQGNLTLLLHLSCLFAG